MFLRVRFINDNQGELRVRNDVEVSRVISIAVGQLSVIYIFRNPEIHVDDQFINFALSLSLSHPDDSS